MSIFALIRKFRSQHFLVKSQKNSIHPKLGLLSLFRGKFQIRKKLIILYNTGMQTAD
jgi:hypothetical protein